MSMMQPLLLLLLVLNIGCSTMVHGESASSSFSNEVTNFRSRMNSAFEGIFSAQNESYAMWIALSHPEYGDQYFVYGNSSSSSSSSSGTAPPNIPATLNDTFQIGSISKTFLGTAMLLMEERGDLSLNNDTVEKLIPDFARRFPQYANYTVEDLLQMDTVVGDFLNDAGGILNNYTLDVSTRYTPEEIVAYAVRDGYYPRDAPEYSTTNFVVGDIIVENITGQAIEDVIRELVFDPLNLTHMQLPGRYSDGILPEPAATPYMGPACLGEFQIYGASEGLVVNQDITDLSRGIVMAGTGGAINSNIHDLLMWAKSGTGDALLTEETVTRRHEHTGAGYPGYGIAQYEYRDIIAEALGEDDRTGWRGHARDAFGYGAYAFHNDDIGASFAGAVNTCSADFVTLYLSLDAFRKELEEWKNASELPVGSTTTNPMPSSAPASTAPPALPSSDGVTHYILRRGVLIIIVTASYLYYY